MPGRDGTGPVGMGRMTGKGRGRCAGISAPGYMITGSPKSRETFRGDNAGTGAGRGRGLRRMYHATGLPGWARWGMYTNRYTTCADNGGEPSVDEKKILSDQAAFLEEQLGVVRERLASLQED